jgi:peptidoglycan hydrolase-like protein with peptidoglycan-binding domain
MKYPNPELTNLKMDDETSKDGVMKFIGTLHPKFYDAFKNIETSNLSNQEKTIVDTMQKIQKLDASKEDIINMQAALQTLNCYPSNHKKENQDGIPGPFTQVALQNFVFKNNLI